MGLGPQIVLGWKYNCRRCHQGHGRPQKKSTGGQDRSKISEPHPTPHIETCIFDVVNFWTPFFSSQQSFFIFYKKLIQTVEDIVYCVCDIPLKRGSGIPYNCTDHVLIYPWCVCAGGAHKCSLKSHEEFS